MAWGTKDFLSLSEKVDGLGEQSTTEHTPLLSECAVQRVLSSVDSSLLKVLFSETNIRKSTSVPTSQRIRRVNI